MKTTIFIISLFLLAITSVAQENWQLLRSENGIEVYYQNQMCEPEAGFDQEKVILKVVNTTVVSKTIDWDIHMWYNAVCKTCDVDTGEYHKTISLAANEEQQGGCSVYSNFDLCVFVQFTDINYTGNKQVLTKFELANFLVVDQ
mgnify:FL=1